MKNARVVIGAGFGDEGKGLTVDYLAQNWADLVVRFNGGANAAHSVYRASTRHVFSHFGSATLQGVPTYLSEHFVVNPILFLKEYFQLIDKEDVSTPKVYVNKDCMVTTMLDTWINQAVENHRGISRHGSCGTGLNETITRHLDSPYKLTVGILQDSTLAGLVFERILDCYVQERLTYLGVIDALEVDRKVVISNFLQDAASFLDKVTVVDSSFLNNSCFNNVLFEGAQGLLLDEFHPYYPHVTRSRTGLTNVDTLLSSWQNLDSLEVYYVTRCYKTRHGAGPFPTEVNYLDGINMWDPTNVHNEFQGTLRVGMLDLEELYHTITSDIINFNNNSKINVTLVVTCLDQVMGKIRYISKKHNGVPVWKHEPLETFFGDLLKMKFRVLINISPITPKYMAQLEPLSNCC